MRAPPWMPLAAIALLAAGPAGAQMCTATPSLVSFGTYDPMAAAANDSIGSVTVSCSGAGARSVSYRVMLARGGGPRRLTGTGAAADYQLYTDPSHTQVWGDCSGSTSCVSGSLAPGRAIARRTYPIYARMPAHQHVQPGQFGDVVVVMLSY